MFLEHLWISEDQRFFQHEGFDWKEMDLAVKEAERKGKPVRGASTITNQCARSIFLWQGRSWIRKGLESYYTIWMEMLLPKRRILELYANVIEMGRGIYGVEAASQHYFGVSARGLTREQSAMLAAVLPNPKGWDPTNPSRMLRWRQRRILRREAARISPRSCFIDPRRVNGFASRGSGLASNHVSECFYVVKGFASRGSKIQKRKHYAFGPHAL